MQYNIYSYWNNMNRPQGDTVRYGVLGNALNSHSVITWSHVEHCSNSGDYIHEVVLCEDGAIRFRYNDADETSCFDQYSYSSVINQNGDILYAPNPINTILLPRSCTKIHKIALSTYDTNGVCDCAGVASASNNGANGTGNGVSPVRLDYGAVGANSKECGYFEVDIK